MNSSQKSELVARVLEDILARRVQGVAPLRFTISGVPLYWVLWDMRAEGLVRVTGDVVELTEAGAEYLAETNS